MQRTETTTPEPTPAPRPTGDAEPPEPRHVPTVTEHNEHMHAERPGDCIGHP